MEQQLEEYKRKQRERFDLARGREPSQKQQTFLPVLTGEEHKRKQEVLPVSSSAHACGIKDHKVFDVENTSAGYNQQAGDITLGRRIMRGKRDRSDAPREHKFISSSNSKQQKLTNVIRNPSLDGRDATAPELGTANIEASPNSKRKRRNVSGSAPNRTREDSNARQSDSAGAADLCASDTQNSASSGDSIIKVMSWNVDGLNGNYLVLRTLGVVDVVKEELPDVILLQEVVPDTLRLFRRSLGGEYSFIDPATSRHCLSGGKAELFGVAEAYFCVILVNKLTLIQRGDPEVVWFPTSIMGRHLLATRLSPSSHSSDEIVIMTSHLESCKEHAEERARQLGMVFSFMEHLTSSAAKDAAAAWGVPAASPNVCSVIFGGDMNLTDKQVSTLDIPTSICDVWDSVGRPESCRFTWDTLRNNNCDIKGRFKPRIRFDRVYCCSRPSDIASPQSSQTGTMKKHRTKTDSVSSSVGSLPPSRCSAAVGHRPNKYNNNVLNDVNSNSSNSSSSSTNNTCWIPFSMRLVGVNKMESIGMHASDHFGIVLQLRRTV